MFSSQMDLYCRLPVSREVLVSRPDEVVLLDRLFRTMSPLEATGSDGNRSIWIRLERGGPEDWCPYEEWKEDCAYDSEDTSREAWLDEWKSWNPYECEWYRIWIAEHDGYRCMGVTNSLVVEYDPRPHPVTWANHPEPEGRLVRFFSLLIPEVEKAVKMVADDTYRGFLLSGLPYRHRWGRILRRDLWDCLEGSRERSMQGLTPDEIEDFRRELAAGCWQYGEVPPIKDMTARVWFHMIALGYDAIGNYRAKDEGDARRFEATTFCKSSGIFDIDPDSSEEFRKWLKGDTWMGGHPFEVVLGGSSTRVSLYVRSDEEGFHVCVSTGVSWGEAVRFFLAIRKAGYPVGIHDGEAFLAALDGIDNVGIVPDDPFPRHCSHLFEDCKVISFLSIEGELEGNEELLRKAYWYEPYVSVPARE